MSEDFVMSPWRLYSFCRTHANFMSPDDLRVYVGRQCADPGENRMLALRMRQGLAYWLGYYQHSGALWFRSEAPPPGADCIWDSVRYAGLAVWCGSDDGYKPPKPKDRVRSIDEFLASYTDWINGVETD